MCIFVYIYAYMHKHNHEVVGLTRFIHIFGSFEHSLTQRMARAARALRGVYITNKETQP